MKWRGRRQSTNVDDQRGRRMSGGMGGLPGGLLTKGGLGVVVVIFIASWLMGENPLTLLQQMQGDPGNVVSQSDEPYVGSAKEEEMAAFTKVVLADTEDVWKSLLDGYREPTLVLFSGQVKSACGFASAASGPFYCSADEKLYIDLGFYDELKSRFNAPGDFAQAYVIAHEVGHHVQHLMGITDKVHAMREQLNDEDYNALSVKLELQADFLAGVWANHAKDMNESDADDFEEAIRAAGAIGDDRIQMQSQGYIVPDSFTHGTSEQRIRWFQKGFKTGDINQGDTFSATSL